MSNNDSKTYIANDQDAFYDGHYFSTELLTIQYVDYASSRPMALGDANDPLQALFSASGWK